MASILKNFQKSDQMKSFFRGWQRGRWPDTVLLSADRSPGSQGSEKRRLQRWVLGLAQSHFCEKEDPLGCGYCPSCCRIERGLSEHIITLEPVDQIISIEAVRQLSQRLSLAPIGRHRLIIIESAHTMNAFAANLLLKRLEEPPERNFFFLLSDAPHRLLKTVRSRSQHLRFTCLKEKNELQESEDFEDTLEEWQREFRERAREALEMALVSNSDLYSFDLGRFLKGQLKERAGWQKMWEIFAIEAIRLGREKAVNLKKIHDLFSGCLHLEESLLANGERSLAIDDFLLKVKYGARVD